MASDPADHDADDVLGIVLAGGASRRFGSPKERALLAGRTLGERAVELLRSVTGRVGVVGGDTPPFREMDVPVRPDNRPGLGPVEGIATGLSWAEEEGCRGIVCTPCDTPLIPRALLAHLIATARGIGAACVLPSGQPACAYYDVRIRDSVTAFIDGGGRSLHALVEALPDRAILPEEELRRFGNPAAIFLNVNDRDTLSRAEQLLTVPE